MNKEKRTLRYVFILTELATISKLLAYLLFVLCTIEQLTLFEFTQHSFLEGRNGYITAIISYIVSLLLNVFRLGLKKQ